MTKTAAERYPASVVDPPAAKPPFEGVRARGPRSYRCAMAMGVTRRADASRRSSGSCATAATADELLEALAGELHRAVPHDGAGVVRRRPGHHARDRAEPGRGPRRRRCATRSGTSSSTSRTPRLFADLARGDGAAALRLVARRPAGAQRPLPRLHAAAGLRRRAARASSAPATAPGASSACTAKRRTRRSTTTTSPSCKAISGVGRRARCVRTSREANPWLGQPSAPGLLVIDRDGRVVSANAEAHVAGCASCGRWRPTPTCRASTPSTCSSCANSDLERADRAVRAGRAGARRRRGPRARAGAPAPARPARPLARAARVAR